MHLTKKCTWSYPKDSLYQCSALIALQRVKVTWLTIVRSLLHFASCHWPREDHDWAVLTHYNTGETSYQAVHWVPSIDALSAMILLEPQSQNTAKVVLKTRLQLWQYSKVRFFMHTWEIPSKAGYKMALLPHSL